MLGGNVLWAEGKASFLEAEEMRDQLDDAAARNVELPEGQVGRCAHKVLIYDLYT